MLDPVMMHFTQLLLYLVLTLLVEVEVHALKDVVVLHYLIEDIDVERQTLHCFQVLDQFSAQRTADSILSVKLSQAIRAESVSAVHEDPWNPFSHVVLKSAELADV